MREDERDRLIELDKTGFALERPLVSGRARLEFEVPEAKGSHTAPTMATLVKQQKPLPEVWPSAENKRRPLLRQTIARARAGYG